MSRSSEEASHLKVDIQSTVTRSLFLHARKSLQLQEIRICALA